MENTKQPEFREIKGAMVARAGRYAIALMAGYFAGVALGSQGLERPPVVVAVVLVGLALLLAFRRGQRSQSHAAADAAAAAISAAVAQARSEAISQSINHVNIGGGTVAGVDFSRASVADLMTLGGRAADPVVRESARLELQRRQAGTVMGYELVPDVETVEVER